MNNYIKRLKLGLIELKWNALNRKCPKVVLQSYKMQSVSGTDSLGTQWNQIAYDWASEYLSSQCWPSSCSSALRYLLCPELRPRRASCGCPAPLNQTSLGFIVSVPFLPLTFLPLELKVSQWTLDSSSMLLTNEITGRDMKRTLGKSTWWTLGRFKNFDDDFINS